MAVYDSIAKLSKIEKSQPIYQKTVENILFDAAIEENRLDDLKKDFPEVYNSQIIQKKRSK